MSAGFFIEFRLLGYARKYADWVKERGNTKAKQLRIKRLKIEKEIPHITLFGPAQANNMKQIVSQVMEVGRKYTLVPFTIGGFSRFDNKTSKVIYLDVNPSPELDQFRWELAQRVLRLAATDSPFDSKKGFKFHSTIKKFTGISDRDFNALCDHLEKNCSLEDYDRHRMRGKVTLLDKLWNLVKKHVLEKETEDRNIGQHLLRVTVLGKGRRIQCEYDLVLKTILNRKQALSRYWWSKTIAKFKQARGQS